LFCGGSGVAISADPGKPSRAGIGPARGTAIFPLLWRAGSSARNRPGANSSFRSQVEDQSMNTLRRRLIAVALGMAAMVGANAAEAACTKLFYSVNDYGKDGPARDAQALLDTFIAKWAAEKGVKKYRTGKKEVECKLFLDFGVFDEYTCKATANVCW
jgi:hypothetical protein